MKYNLIYADPPWQYRDKAAAGKRGAGFKYPVMSIDDICQMSEWINEIAAPNCLLAMWWVAPMPAEALTVVQDWCFTLKTMKGFTWHKLTKHGKDHFGMGHYTRSNSEDCLFAVKGRPKIISHSVSQIITAPVREHSRKPPEVRELLVKLCGDVPRIELFAREAADGWKAWGNETEKFEL